VTNKAATPSTDQQSEVDAVTAARREYEMQIENASKSEYQQALQLAASHLPPTKPLTKGDRRALRDLIKSLQEQLRGRPRGGNPDDIRPADLIPAAERAVTELVREGQRLWREKNGRRRVPQSVTAELIAEAIKRISIQCQGSVPTARISAHEVRRLLNKK
jgi:hypothetical protein